MADLGWSAAELALLGRAAARLQGGFTDPWPGVGGTATPDMAEVLLATADRLRDNYPYHQASYAGQMLKPPHPVARLAYALAMTLNPNNHARDGGRASSEMEQECIAELGAMVGWSECLGHLTGGGTLANLEAIWIAARLAPGRTLLASSEAHYTHQRLCAVLGIPFEAIAVDAGGRLDPEALARRLEQGDVGTVVATLGTTGCGAVDPLPALLELRDQHGFRLHADAAYGGYFGLTSTLGPDARAAYAALGRVDSLVVDPHKHGLQPYGCGAVLHRDPAVARYYLHESPYTYFTDAGAADQARHLGEISLECSRAGAAAVALWATHRLLPPRPGGEFAAGLERGLEAARALHRRLLADAGWLTLMAPQLDIVVWAPAAASARAISERSQAVFDAAAERGLDLALMRVSASLAARHWPDRVAAEDGSVTCLRCCLLKPEHLDHLDGLWALLGQALEGSAASA